MVLKSCWLSEFDEEFDKLHDRLTILEQALDEQGQDFRLPSVEDAQLQMVIF